MIAIISATKEEVCIFAKEIVSAKTIFVDGLEVTEGIFLNESVVLIISGVGIKRAKNATTLAATKYRPKFTISAGFSGALDKNLIVGDIVIGCEVISLKEQKTYKLFSDFPYIPFDYKKGSIISNSNFINNRKEKKELKNISGALSVDMETFGVASVAKKYGIKVVAVRTVSDNLDYSLPRMEKLFDSNSRLSPSKCIKYFLQNPQHIMTFLRFKFINLRKAKIKLNHFLLIFIPILIESDI